MKKVIFLFVVSGFFSINLLAQAATGDPWIKKVFNATWGREPTAIEYNIKRYHDGQWNNYNELMNYIYETQKNEYQASITYKYSQKLYNSNQVVVGVFKSGMQIASALITNDGGSIVASGGGNIISTNGGGIVASGGGNIVASGGGNIAVMPLTKGIYFGSSRTLQATGTIVVPTSAGGTMIIK